MSSVSRHGYMWVLWKRSIFSFNGGKGWWLHGCFQEVNQRTSISVRLQIRSHLAENSTFWGDVCGTVLEIGQLFCRRNRSHVRAACLHLHIFIFHYIPITPPDGRTKSQVRSSHIQPHDTIWYPWLVHIPAAGNIWSTAASCFMIDRYHQYWYVVGHMCNQNLSHAKGLKTTQLVRLPHVVSTDLLLWSILGRILISTSSGKALAWLEETGRSPSCARKLSFFV